MNRLTGLPNGQRLIVADVSANRTAFPFPQESRKSSMQSLWIKSSADLSSGNIC